jgi:hypothetical protein
MRDGGIVNTSTSEIIQSNKNILGGYREGVTPVPIPNTEVKPFIVDGTALEREWESRTPPGLKYENPLRTSRGFFCCIKAR